MEFNSGFKGLSIRAAGWGHLRDAHCYLIRHGLAWASGLVLFGICPAVKVLPYVTPVSVTLHLIHAPPTSVLRHLTVFPVDLPSLNTLHGDVTRLCYRLVTV